MSELTDLFRQSLAGGSLLALPLAVAGGFAAGLNPCCLPLYPAAAATCCSAETRRAVGVLWRGVAFVLGGALAMSVLGALAAWAGRAVTGLGGWALYAIALVPLLIGLHLLGWLRLPMPTGEQVPRVGVVGAFVVGLLISMVLAPCGTPFLASALSYAAYQGSAPYGTLLLFLYGLGAGLPVLSVGTAAGVMAARLRDAAWRSWIDRLAGVLFLGLAFYLLSRA